MANTFFKIASVTVGSGGASNIEFTSIPQTYTDLCLKVSARSNNSQYYDYLVLKFNGSSSNLASSTLYGTGAGVGSTASAADITFGALNGNNATTSTFANSEYYIPNYTSSNYKSVNHDGVEETNATSVVFAFLTAGLWSNTAAITSIALTQAFGTAFQEHSTATLYGISKS